MVYLGKDTLLFAFFMFFVNFAIYFFTLDPSLVVEEELYLY